MQLARVATSFLARCHEHRPAKQYELRSEVNARSGRHEFDRAVVAIHTHKWQLWSTAYNLCFFPLPCFNEYLE